jgi:hypothetical protein
MLRKLTSPAKRILACSPSAIRHAFAELAR